MKKRMKWAALGLSVVMAVSLAACGSSDSGSGSASTTGAAAGSTAASDTAGADASTTSGSAAAVGKQITVTALASPGPINEPIDNFSDNEFFQKFADKTGMTIEFTHPTTGNESTEFDLNIASGDYYDLFWGIAASRTGSNDLYKDGDAAGIDDGVFRDLTDYVEEYMPNYWNILQKYDEARKLAYTDDGRLVNLVALEFDEADDEIEPQPSFAGITIRKDWLDELGLEVPVTYDDWTNVLTQFKEKYNCSQPLYMCPKGYWVLMNFAAGYGAGNGLYVDNGKIQYGPATEGWKKYVTLLHDWYEKGLIGSEYLTNDAAGLDAGTAISEETGAMFQVYTMTPMIENGTEGGAKWVACQLPVEKEGEVAQMGANDGLVAAKKIYVSTHVSDEDLPAVLSALDYLYSDEGARLAAIGEEGETYTENDDGSYTFTDKILNNPEADNTPSTAFDMYLCPGNYMLLKDWSRENATSSEEQLEMAATWDKDGNDMVIPPISMSSEENAAASGPLTDIQTYVDESTNNFIMGGLSIDNDWDSYVETINSMGLADVLSAYQSAYDRYMSR